LVESEIVELRNETGDERAGGRRSTDELDGSVLNDQNVISDSSDIWEATVGGIPELLSWLNDGAVGEVGSDSGGLVWWLRDEVREASTSGEASSLDCARNFLDISGADAVGSGADWGSSVARALSRDEGGGSDGGDESRGGGEEWVEWMVGEGAVIVGWSRGSSVTRGGLSTGLN